MEVEQALWNYFPPVTKYYFISTTSLMVLCSLEIISPFSLYLNWNLIVREWQIWRIVTCFLFLGEFGLTFFWNMYMLVFYCGRLESDVFRGKSADFLWMLLTCSAMLLIISFVSGPGFFFSGPMLHVMTYVWGRRNPFTRMSVFFFTVRAPYIPWVLSALSFLVGWHMSDHLMGILVGHIYYFFEDIYPLMPTSKGFRLFKTPKFLNWIMQETED
eukprot:Lankesteria_metandrocarpae@DN238_c0_g1_i1.p1